MKATRLVSSSVKLTKARRKTWLCSCCDRLFHNSSQAQSLEGTYGVGPTRGSENDPVTKGSVPDDRRADEQHHAGEPKEVTKEKAAIAQQEPADFQVTKTMPGWSKTLVQPEESSEEKPSTVSKFIVLPVDHESLWRAFGIAPTFA